MKKQLIVLATLASLIAVTPARADLPVFTPPQYTTTVKCDKQTPVDADSGTVKIECSPQDLKTYPFLAQLTQDPTAKGSIYKFDIARVEDKNLGKSIYLLKMYNETIYTIWGSAAGIIPSADGTTSQMWTVVGGTVVDTASCPKQFGYIIKGNEHDDLAEWVYDGMHINRIVGYNKLESFPACN